MAAPIVVPALRALDSQLTAVAPKRTLPTWFAGDAAHRKRTSGHNPDDTPGSKAEYSDSDNIPEIRAADIRLPFNAPFTPEQFVQWLVKECRANRIDWISYIIFNGRIWSEKSGWVTRTYTGSNKHEHHVHVSCKGDAKSEATTKDMGLRALITKPAKPKPPAAKPKPKLPVFKNGSRQNSRTKNNRGTDVAKLQSTVGVKADGLFGNATEAAVKRYQSRNHLRPDGVAGPNTWRKVLRK